VRCGKIIGGVNDRTRNEYVLEFNRPDSPLRVMVGNIRAMGTGLNLQDACSHAIFLDLDWSPGSNEQAEDRLHRQGQENNVTIHIIQAEDTVDGFIALKLEQKQGLIEGIIERDELRRALQEGLI
jgi:SNF2 family DNA or RNA helicase